VDTLGIEYPVLVVPHEVQIPNALGAMHGMDDFGQWQVEVDDTVDYSREGERDLSYVLWHELGHVVDYEQRARQTGVHPNLLMDHVLEKFYRPLQEAMRYGLLDAQAWQDEYRKIPAEQFANEIANRHSHAKLHTPIMVRPAGVGWSAWR